MKLVPYTDADLPLTEAFELDPGMMRYLGGPTPAEGVLARHKRKLETIAKGDWWFKIAVEGDPVGAGGIGIWRREQDGETINEMGWMILPAHQGRGLATLAGREVLARARAAEKFKGQVHAFCHPENAASNAVCRKLGFVLFGPRELDSRAKPGEKVTMLDWRLEL